MEELKSIEVDEQKAEKLLRKIIMQEKKNIKTKEFSDHQMVKNIMKMIEEEVECF